MLKRLFHRKQKQPVVTPPLAQKASPKTKKAIKFFNDEIPATELLEDNKSKKFVHSGYEKTLYDKFFEQFESKDFWGTLALIVTGVFITAVIYWGFNQ